MNQEQLDCLHVECKQWVDDGLDFLKSGITYGQALELIEALKEAQQDAERYRWLRAEHNYVMGKVMVCDGWMLEDPDEVNMVENLDAFIDEKIREIEA